MSVLSCLALSCVNTVRVHEKTAEGEFKAIKGIPFYSKIQVPQRTTVHSRTWLSATLRAERAQARPDKKGAPETNSEISLFTRVVSSESLTALREIETQISRGHLDLALEMFLALPQSPHNAFNVTENSVAYVDRVDHKTTYYLNAPLAWIGSTEFTPELASDGTLSKLQVKVESQVDEAIDAVVGAITSLTASGDVDAIVDTPQGFTDAQEDDSVIKRLTLTTKKAMEYKEYTRIYWEGSTTIEELGEGNYESFRSGIKWEGDTPKPVDKPKTPTDPKSTISFSGAVSLPTEPKKP